MTSSQMIQAVEGQGIMSAGDAAMSDQVGCPDVINYVYTEGEYDIGVGNGFNLHRVCSVRFQCPPGTLLSFDWTQFALSSVHGSCSGTPAQCSCDGQESVIIRDGLRDNSRQVGQTMCGSFSPGR